MLHTTVCKCNTVCEHKTNLAEMGSNLRMERMITNIIISSVSLIWLSTK